ncbi:fatty acid hydroxylase family protein [archaeon]|nr:MAG: fatty acid hydroxylase family protein [archaeon]
MVVNESDGSSSNAGAAGKRIIASALLWPSIIVLPLVLTHNDLYKRVFSSEWYDTQAVDYWYRSDRTWPSPLGLSLGLLAVTIGQICTLIYFILWKNGSLGLQHTAVQKSGAPEYVLWEGLAVHLAQPEGFLMLGGYLTGTWMLGLMPSSYYSFSGGINVFHVMAQLLITDFIQYVMHKLEHDVSPKFYQLSHKPHHRFTNPKLFDAFNGSPTDTFCMILIPLAITARLVPANVWSYMAFGSLYANWLTLIHSEYKHPWDDFFRALGFGTAADHHVHHKLFIYNFGHLFMYWDKLLNTYKDPKNVREFNKDV